MADEPRTLRSGRYYTEAELAAAALAAVHRAVGHGKAYPSRAALIAALNAGTPEGTPEPVNAPSLSAALALADPARPGSKYDRGQKVRRLILRRLPPGFVVADEPRWNGEPDPTDVLPLP